MTWLLAYQFGFLAVLLVGVLFCLAMLIREHWPRIEALRLLRRMPSPVALAMLVAFVALYDFGSTKGPVIGPRLLATYLSIMADGTLRGPTNEIASATGAAAIDAVNGQNANMLSVISNGTQWARNELPLLEQAVDETQIVWLHFDIPQSLNSSNLVARCDLMRSEPQSNGLVNCYMRFNMTPDTAPIIVFEASPATNVVMSCPVVSNSFPRLYPVARPDGVSSCYVYTVSIPDELQGVTLVPIQGVTFGGGSANDPLKVLGALMVNTYIGRTTTVQVDTNIWDVFEGGVLVGVTTNYP